MHALQVGTMEARSAAMPLPWVAALHSSTLSPSPESFGLKWRQEMEASGRSSAGQLPASENASSVTSVIKNKVPIPTTGATSGEDSKTKAVDTVPDALRDQRVVTSAPVPAAPTLSGPGSRSPVVKAAGDLAATLNGRAAILNTKAAILNLKFDVKIPSHSNVVAGPEPQKEASVVALQPAPTAPESVPVAAQLNSMPTEYSKPLHDLKIPGQFNSIAGAESQKSASAVPLQSIPVAQADVAAARVETVPSASSKPKHDAKYTGHLTAIGGAESQKNLSAVAGPPIPYQQSVPVATQVDVSPNATNENSEKATGTLSGTKAILPPKVTGIEKDGSLQSAQVTDKSAGSVTGKQGAGTTIGEPRDGHASGSATESAIPSPVAGAASLISTASGDLHANLLETPGSASPVLLPGHPSSQSSPYLAPLVAADAADAKGNGSPAIVSSGPTQLDVGVFDGTHGWLRIRAELGAGGVVNASLTASASAHESLRAALPAMTNFLGSEAVSVTSIAVHRFAQESHTMSAQDQPNGDAQGHQAASDQAQDNRGAQRKTVTAMDKDAEPSASVATSRPPDPHPSGVEDTGSWTRGFSGATSLLAWPSAVSGGSRGGWLNVSA